MYAIRSYYAHKDIAFQFGMWISPKFQLLLVKEYQRLKVDENDRLQLDWDLQRTLSKINYHIHTDAIKENLIPVQLSKKQGAARVMGVDLSENMINQARILEEETPLGIEYRVENVAKLGQLGRFVV